MAEREKKEPANVLYTVQKRTSLMVLGPAAFFTQLWDFPLLLPKAPQFDKMSNFVQFLNNYHDIPYGILMLTNYLKF